MFSIRDRQGGNVIDSFDSLEAATYALNEYEEADKLAKEAAGINSESPLVDEDLIELNPASDLYSYIDEIEKENKTDKEESDVSSSDDSE